MGRIFSLPRRRFLILYSQSIQPKSIYEKLFQINRARVADAGVGHVRVQKNRLRENGRGNSILKSACRNIPTISSSTERTSPAKPSGKNQRERTKWRSRKARSTRTKFLSLSR